MRNRLRIAVAVTVVALAVGAWARVSEVSTPSEITFGKPGMAVGGVDEVFLHNQVDRVAIPESGGAFMVAVMAGDGEVVYSTKGTDPRGSPPTPNSAFRIASITKVFTAVATLSLVDDGLVGLDAPAVDYVSRVPVPDDVTVRDLLQHTSGIPDFTANSPDWKPWLADPGRKWTPEETAALVAGMEPVFPAGSAWHWSYSNTNYIVLGVLIEEVTGQSFAAVVRTRIIEPLGLDNTYLAGFESGPDVFAAYTTSSERQPAHPIEFDYTSLATSAWAAGGMVSTAPDLHSLFTGLFEGRLVSSDILEAMLENTRHFTADASDYGLGLQVWSRLDGRSVEGLVGHSGGMIGYATRVVHSRSTGITAFWVATSNAIDMSPTFAPVSQRIADRE